MNKKGALFHWILLGLLIAVGIFFLEFQEGDIELPIKGQWHFNFLDNYASARQEMIISEHIVKRASWETVLEMTSKGGVFERTDCSNVIPYPFWNTVEKECYPDVQDVFAAAIGPKLKVKLPKISFTNFEVSENFVITYGYKANITSLDHFYSEYSYFPNYKIDVGYSFREYDDFVRAARGLVERCRNSKDLDLCLEQKIDWKSGPCEGEAGPFSSVPRMKRFCVLSSFPVYNEKAEKVTPTYKFRLDFTPTGPLSVENIDLKEDDDKYKIEFAFDEAERYKIYYTDFLQAKEKTGDPDTIFGSILTSVFSWEFVSFDKKDIVSDIGSCGSDQKLGTPYRCGDNIIYNIDKSLVPVSPSNFIFTVTTIKNNEESDVQTWVD